MDRIIDYYRWNQTMIKGHRQGHCGSWSCSHCTLHVLSLIHCLAWCFTLSLSISFPSSHIFLSSSTYFIGGGGCRCATRCSVWETQSKTGTDSSRCTDHSGGLHHLTSPLCFILHLKFALCICWGLLSPRLSPVSLFPLKFKYIHAIALGLVLQKHCCPNRVSYF